MKLFDFDKIAQGFESHGKAILIAAISVIALMAAAAVIVFFMFLQGEERVMMPNVGGKELSIAMLELQAKELYPRIQLRYSDTPEEKGCVIEQSPNPGAIVKAGRYVNLVVSRGAVVDKVENYVGQNIDEVKIHLQSLFTSTLRPLISIKEPPLYRHDGAPAGSILEQDPPAGAEITEPVELTLVVSRGLENEKVTVENLLRLSVREALLQIEKSKVVYNFTDRAPNGSEPARTVVSQTPAPGSLVDAYSIVDAVITKDADPRSDTVFGIFTQDLPEYPYPLEIRLESLLPSGERTTIVKTLHPGKLLTIPFETDPEAVLILTILNKEVSRRRAAEFLPETEIVKDE